MLLTLDFETYFDVRCSLGKMTTMEYINDSDFKVHGASLKFDDEPAEWYPHDELTEALAQVAAPDLTALSRVSSRVAS